MTHCIVLTFTFPDGSAGFDSYELKESNMLLEAADIINYHNANYNIKDFKLQVMTKEESQQLFELLLSKLA